MPIDFQPYDEREPVRIYHRHLPHWRQGGATYFVTFRLYDSLPKHCVQHLDQLRKSLLTKKNSDASYLEADREYFAKMKHYLDAGHGKCWMRREEAKQVVKDALTHFDGERYQLGGYAVMPNHVHALVKPLTGHDLEDTLHGWKSVSARRINKRVGRTGKLWQDETYDRIVRDPLELARTTQYIQKHNH